MLDCLFNEMLCFDGIHAREIVNREIGKVAHNGAALTRIEYRAHVGAHARERPRRGGVVGTKALAQFACDTLRKCRRTPPGVDRRR